MRRDQIYNDFYSKVKRLFKFTNGKTVVLWGYGQNGWFIEHLFNRHNKKIEYIIDEYQEFDMTRKLHKNRSVLLKWLDPEVTVVVLSFKKNQLAEEYLNSCGYKYNESYIYASELFYGEISDRFLSYYDYLEYQYGLDLVKKKSIAELNYTGSDNYGYSCNVEYALQEVLCEFAFSENEDAVFDFGFGKGGALVMFYMMGVAKLGGVEYDKELYLDCIQNFKRIGLSSDGLINGDAAEVRTQLDNYNYFFAYNPFGGEVFKSCVKAMEESVNRKPRNICFIYEAPVFHLEVIKSGRFKLSKQIDTDVWIRNVNIYLLKPEEK